MTEESGSTFMVPLTKILNVRPHDNADKLEIAKVFDFEVIVGKGSVAIGDEVLYIPVDSVLSTKVEEVLFSTGKIKLNKSRVRATKIRGFVSHGMVARPEALGLTKVKLDVDYKELLGITKYEPPAPNMDGMRAKTNRVKLKDHPLFHSYNGINNIKWYPTLFEDGEQVVIQEKLHGTNARYSILPYTVDTLWRKFKKFLGLTPKYENNYGSNNVQISRKFTYSGFYGEDVYGSVAKRLNIFDKLRPNEIIYGEIIGEGIQKNYSYGHKEHHFVLFDVKVYDETTKEMKWLSPEEVKHFAMERGFDLVPELWNGPWDKEVASSLVSGKSIYNPSEKVREGIVVKSVDNYNCPFMKADRKSVKWINDDYLLDSSNTDNH